ncbi:MAG: PHP domain-containing protein [Thermoplasmata archaeon]
MDIHIHSSFSDGLDSPNQIAEFAVSRKFDRICITDHIGPGTDWLDDFFEEMERLKEQFAEKIEILSGVEAKVLDLSGRLDANLSQVSRADLVFAAFHRIPQREGYMVRGEIGRKKAEALENWSVSMKAVLANPAAKIIAHPGNILKSNGVEIPRYLKEEIAVLAGRSGKIFEHNLKYGVPDSEFLSLLSSEGVQILPGSDAHSIAELDELWDNWPDM